MKLSAVLLFATLVRCSTSQIFLESVKVATDLVTDIVEQIGDKMDKVKDFFAPNHEINVDVFLHCDRFYTADVYLMENNEVLNMQFVRGDPSYDQHVFLNGTSYRFGPFSSIEPFIFIVHGCGEGGFKRRDQIVTESSINVTWHFDLTKKDNITFDDIPIGFKSLL